MNGPMSRPNNAAAIRGALLVIAAVVVGIYLLRGTDTPTLDPAPGRAHSQGPAVTRPTALGGALPVSYTPLTLPTPPYV